jgi:hypothetical protein
MDNHPKMSKFLLATNLTWSGSTETSVGYRLKVKIETTRHYDEKGLHLDFYLNLFNDNKYNINRFR